MRLVFVTRHSATPFCVPPHWLPIAAAAMVLACVVSVSFDVAGVDIPDIKDVVVIDFSQ